MEKNENSHEENSVLTESKAKDISAKKTSDFFVGKLLYQLVVIFGVVFIFSIFIGRIVFFPMTVVGVSMQPNFNELATNQGNNHTDTVYVGSVRKIEIGDVIVFDSGNVIDDETQYYIKRVVGTPGDIISFKIMGSFSNYVTYVLERNGRVVDESYISESMKCFFTRTNEESKFYEDFLLPNDNSKEKIELGLNEYFLMGDNRNFSTDSRVFGPVSKKKIVGKVYLHIEYGDSIIKAIFKKIF